MAMFFKRANIIVRWGIFSGKPTWQILDGIMSIIDFARRQMLK